MKKVLFFLLVLVAFTTKAQYTSQTGFTAQQLAEMLAGPNVTVFNASLSGSNGAIGKFTAPNTNLDIASGVSLSSGLISGAGGTNNSSSTSNSNGTSGTAQMDAIAGVQTYDAITLQFDFTLQTPTIEFNYIFGSEEYPEYVGGSFNDVFAFFISGPGISGEENIALIPNTTVPVTINNVNDASYWQYYVDNTSGTTMQPDGFTRMLTAKKTGLIPCQTYTLKLVICDAGDSAFDSWVFLQEGSLVQGEISAISNTVTTDNTSLEGCTKASFTFTLNEPQDEPTEIKFNIGGNAVNGVDYKYIDSLFVIPKGQVSATIFIEALADGFPEGQEAVELYFYPIPCEDPDTVFLFINDNEPIDYLVEGFDLSCNNDNTGEIVAHITGGNYPYTLNLIDALGNETLYNDTIISGLAAGTYQVEVDDQYGCGGNAIVVGASYDAGQTFLPDGNGNIYTTTLTITDFPAGETLNSISQFQSVCLNMEHSYLGDLEIILIAPNGTEVLLKERPGGNKCNLGEPVAKGPVDGANSDITPGVGYEYCFTIDPTYGTMVSEKSNYNYTYVDAVGETLTDNYLPQGSYASYEDLANLIGTELNGDWTISVQDHKPQDNGYIFNWSISFAADRQGDIVTLNQPAPVSVTANYTQASCGNGDGGIDITVSSPFSPYSYEWSNGQTDEDASGLAAGSYMVSVTDNNGCVSGNTFLVQNASAPVLTAVASNVTCVGLSNGSVNLSVTGTPISYIWSNGATTEDISGLAASDYFVTVTDGSNCKAIGSYSVLQTPALNINTNEVSNEKCGFENGYIDISVVGGTTPYTYNWNDGTSNQDANYLQAGTFTVTVTDVNSCVTTVSHSIINEVSNCVINCNMTVQVVSVLDENCGNALGALDINPLNGTQPYTYVWSNSAATEDLSGISGGVYAVTITDAQECTATESITVSNITGNISLSASITNETCGNGQGAVNVSVSGGAMPYQYAWSNNSTVQDLNNLSAGSYTLTFTDANFCQDVQTYMVTNNAGTMQQTYGNAMNETCGNSEGSIDITIVGGTGFYNYAWSNGAFSQDLMNISAGNYRCTVTDGSGCKIVTPVYAVLNESGSLAIDDIDVFNETCGNNAGRVGLDIIGGSTPYSYAWSNSQTIQDIENLSAGIYSCVITDNSGCSIPSGNIEVINTAGNLTLSAVNVTDELCSNTQGTAEVIISGGSAPYTYAWSNGFATSSIGGLSSGTYKCTVTDMNGCEVQATALISNNQGSLSVDNLIKTDETCGDASGSVNIVLSGGAPTVVYNWSNGANTEDISGISAGTYTCLVTDGIGCTTSTSAVVANNTSGILLNNVAVTNEVCGNASGAIDITITGGNTPYTYAWSNGATTQDLSGLTAGIYSATVTDNSGCAVNVPTTAINNSAIGVSISSMVKVDEVCSNGAGSINITVAGGPASGYAWSNGATTEDINGLSAGTYTVTVSTSGGCELVKSYVVNNNSGTLAISTPVVTNESCGNSLGSISLTVNGGSTPYAYLWSNGATAEDISGLSAGAYRLTVTDANSCIAVSSNFNVQNNSGTLALTGVSSVSELCNDGTGSLTVNTTGGTTPLTYDWSNGQNTQTATGLNAATFVCTVTDANGCSISAYGTVGNNPGSLEVVAETIIDINCSSTAGSIDITLAGTSSAVTYLWSNGATTEDISGLSAGNYVCSIWDNGCYLSYNAQVVNYPSTLTIAVASTNPDCNADNGTASVAASGGTAPYTYLWSNGATTSSISLLATGTYDVSVYDSQTCFQSGTATIQQGQLVVSLVSKNDDYCGQGWGDVQFNVSGGDGIYTYSLNGMPDPWGFPYWGNLSAGDYLFEVMDGSGCGGSMSVTILNETFGFGISSASISNDNCNYGIGAVDITVGGGVSPYSYVWSNSENSQDISGLMAGTFTVSVTDNNFCTTYETYTVGSSSDVSLTLNATNETCGQVNGSISTAVSGGSTPYTYNWSNGNITSGLSGIAAGIYTLTATDAAACMAIQTITVTNNTGTLSATSVVTDQYCSNLNGAIGVTVSGGATPYTYAWSNGLTTQDVSLLATGTYTQTITDAANCKIVNTHLVDNIGLSAFITWQTDDYCGQGSGDVQFNITGGDGIYTFTLNGNPPQWAGWPYWSGLAAGTYTLEAADGSGCSLTQEVLINNQTNGLSIATTSVTNDYCNQAIGAINITANGGTSPYLYDWSTSATSEDISSLLAGSYTVTVSDDDGCNAIKTINVGGVSAVQVSLSSTNESCGQLDGSISATVSGGASPYTYSWSNGSTLQNISSLGAGVYAVSVEDATGCIGIKSTTITNNTGTLNATAVIASENCGAGDGGIALTVSGGATPYTYAWSNGQTTKNATNLSSGTYVQTITDNTGCKLIKTYNVGLNSIVATTSWKADDYCGQGNGSVQFNITGGDGIYTSTLNGEPEVWMGWPYWDGLSEGDYLLEVYDGSGCYTTKLITINNTTNGLSIVGSVTDDYCGQSVGAIDITANSGTSPYNYEWNGSVYQEDLTALASGSYTVTVTDADGCMDSKDFNVGGASDVVVSLSSTNETCGQMNGTVTSSVNGGLTPYSYMWSNNATTANLTNVSAGDYSVEVSDAAGCIGTASATITNNTGTLSSTATIANEYCTSSNGGIAVSVSGGQSPYSFAWSNGASTKNISGLVTGAYTQTITDALGCKLVKSFDVGNIGINASVSWSTDDWCGQGNGDIQFNVTGGDGIYTYALNGQPEQWAGWPYWSGLTAGNYTLEVWDGSGCYFTGVFSVANQTSGINVSTVSVTNDYCNHGIGAINVSVNSGSTPYSYEWSNGIFAEDISGLSSGAYTISATDATGCVAVKSYTVNGSTDVSISFASSNESCGQANGSITASVSGGDTPYSYLWSNGTTDVSISALTAGTYTVTVTDFSGCVGIKSTSITNNTGGLTSTAVITKEYCTNADGGVAVTVSGGATPYTFAWSNGATTKNIGNLSTGMYTQTITDNTGCKLIKIFDVGQNSINASVSWSGDDWCGQGTGSIQFNITGGDGFYTYTLNGQPDTWGGWPYWENLTAGDYLLEVYDGSGCYFSDAYTVGNQTSGVNVSTVSVSGDYCNQSIGSISVSVLGGTSPYTYNWSNGAFTEDISGLTSGAYTITTSDATGCEAYKTYNVSGSSDVVISMASINENCGQSNGFATATVSGGDTPYSYLWSNNATDVSALNLTAGTYTLEVTDASGCVGTSAVTITNNTGTLSSSASIQNEYCGNLGGQITVSVSGGQTPYSYSWSNGLTTKNIGGLAAGDYTQTITDGAGCKLIKSHTVNSISLNISESWNQPDYCGQGSGEIQFNVTGGDGVYTYFLDGQPDTWGGWPYWTGLVGGDHLFEVYDGSGCYETYTVTIDNNTSGMVVSLSASTPAQCGASNGSLDITASSGSAPYDYLWFNGSTLQDISSLSAGDYDVTVTDNSGCSAFETFTVNGTQVVSISSSVTDDLCAAGSGMIVLTNGTGVAPFTYAWSNGETSKNITNLTSGTYTVTVTSSQSCSTTLIVEVGGATQALSASISVTDADCGVSNGIAAADVVGGTTPYSYAWENSILGTSLGTAASVSGLQSGVQIALTVTDVNGCSAIAQSAITSNLTIAINSTQDVTCNGSNDGAISVDITSGTTPFNYIWEGSPVLVSGNSFSISDLSAGAYTVSVVDGEGCVALENVTITEPDAVEVILSSTNATAVGASDGAVSSSVIGGTGAYSYIWSNGSTDASISGLTAGLYTVTVSDENACSTVATGAVNEPGSCIIAASINATDVTTIGGNDGTATASVTGGTSPYSYAWSNGLSTASISSLNSGVYGLTVTDAASCSTTSSATITEPSCSISVFPTTTDATTNGGSEGTATAVVNGANGTVDYIWSNGGTTAFISGLSVGDYKITVTDDLGCFAVSSASINEPACVLSITVSSTDATTNGGNEGTATVVASGVSSYIYSWSEGSTTETIAGLAAGAYTVTVVDAINCAVTATVNISEPSCAAVSVTITKTDATAFGSSDGTATAVSSGTAPFSYTWSNGATTETISGLPEGLYSVTVVDNVNCSASASVSISDPSGIDDIGKTWLVDVYPNPAIDQVVINSTEEMESIQVTDISGRVVISQTVNASKSVTMNIHALESGVYHITVSGEKSSKILRVIKQ